MHRFIPSSGDDLIAQEKLFPDTGTAQNDIPVQPALFVARMHSFRHIHFVVLNRATSL